MTTLALLLALFAYADEPLPPVRPMVMAESKPISPKATVIGQIPDCSALALKPGVPPALQMRLKQAVSRAKAWQALYSRTWADFGSFDKRCRAYGSGADRKTQDAASIAEIGRMETTLQLHLGTLRLDSAVMAPRPPLKGAPPMKKNSGSFSDLQNDVKALQGVYAKEADPNAADLASRCASALGAQAPAVTSAMARFESRAKTLCVLPAADESESNTH